MADIIQDISRTVSPYTKASYSAAANEKNTLSIESYFKLLAAQLANQDMTNPMNNSEMMAQMTQMAMVQSLGTMTSSMKAEMALSKTGYLAGLIGKEITARVPESERENLKAGDDGLRSGTVISVDLSGEEPRVRLSGDSGEYPLESILRIGAGKTDGASGTGTTGETSAEPNG